MDELVIDNLVYIPSRRAAEITGYAKDYVGQLCREGRIEAKLVGRSWYVLESSIKEHRFGTVAPTVASEVTGEAEEEKLQISEEETVPQPEALEEAVDDSLSTWKPATYSTEEPQIIEESRQTTYLENTIPEIVAEPATASQVQEVQNAWQEWFSKNEHLQVDKEALETQEEASVEVEEPAPEPVIIRKTAPVRLDMMQSDIAPLVSVNDMQPAVTAKGRKQRKSEAPSFRAQKPAGRAMKAVFIGIIILTLAVTVIGTGSLDAISPSWASKGSVVEYLAGVQNFTR